MTNTKIIFFQPAYANFLSHNTLTKQLILFLYISPIAIVSDHYSPSSSAGGRQLRNNYHKIRWKIIEQKEAKNNPDLSHQEYR